jgi:hypothetical protein
MKAAYSEVNINEEKLKAMNAFNILDETGRYTDNLTIADMNNLPIGISRTIGNVEYCIAISNYIHKGDYAELTVYGKVVTPQTENSTLFFGAQGIKFSRSGQFLEEVKLTLLGDISIPIHGNQASLILHGGFDNSTGTGIELTYMAIDCSGFRELGITADIVFSETLIRKVDSGGNPISGTNGRVSGSFHTVVRDWEDILVSIELPRFEIVGIKGFIFEIRRAIFDFSALRNDPAIIFPKKYGALISEHPDSWQGVYIGKLDVALPEQFSRKDQTGRISFYAENMLIDNNGISGQFSAENILSITQGSASGWCFSVNRFSLELETNQLVHASFAGQIGLPVAENANLDYEGVISHNSEYSLTVKPVNSLAFDIWAAQAEIYSNSYIKLAVEDKQFRPEAMLNGTLNINAGKSADANKKIAVMKGIKFTELHLTTKAPYISVKSLGYNGSIKLAGFPLSISDIGLTTDNGRAKLGFKTVISLFGEKNPVAAETSVKVVGITSGSTWKYETVEVSDIGLDATIAILRLKGSLTIMNNDPVYGNGFGGYIQLTMNTVLELDVAVRTIFGNKEDNNGQNFRYWNVDGTAKFSPGIPVNPAMRINGFGGGAYSKMRPTGKISKSTSGSMPQGTGTVYEPDNSYGLGFRAAVMFNVLKESLIDGEASFEIAFNQNGGVNFAGFYGQVKFLGEIPFAKSIEESVGNKLNSIVKKEQEYLSQNRNLNETLTKLKQNSPSEAASKIFEPTEKLGSNGMLAMAGIQYDFANRKLHANFDMYVNIAAGMLKGAGSNSKAGWAVFHSEPNKWYLHVGSPSSTIGLNFNLLGAINIKTGAYFMVGHDIPGSPPPPAEVANILGRDINQLDYMRDMNALGDGKGIAFGANIQASTGDITFLILYANFAAGLGFDIMMKQYNTSCKGSNEKIGVNGWYANGQAYAYLQGELGIKVNLWFTKAKIAIIKGASAVLLQAKLPNPSWFKGLIGVKYSVLGGLIKGSMNFELTFGKECEFVTDGIPLELYDIISEMTPMDSSSEVDVFASPQTIFRMPVEKPFELPDIDGNAKKYRIRVLDFSCNETKASKKSVPGKLEWNSNKDRLTFVPDEMLPSRTQIKAGINVIFEEYKNNTWITVTEGGKAVKEHKEITFTTGDMPDIIPESNIKYVYPVIGQRYFHPGETKRAYVQLLKNQDYLFDPSMKHEIRISAGNNVQTVSVTYNKSLYRVEYVMPDLALNSKYTLEILSRSEVKEQTSYSEERETIQYGSENEVSIRSSSESSVNIQREITKCRLKYDFGTSRFNTFNDKIKNIVKTTPYDTKLFSILLSIGYRIDEGEPFESVELTGTKYTDNKALVNAYATLTDYYYLSKMKPLLYENYPLRLYGSSSKYPVYFNRDISIYGVPPKGAIFKHSGYLTEVERGIFTNYAKTQFPYLYYLPYVYYADFYDLRNRIAKANVIVRLLNRQYNYLLETSFPQMYPGIYEIELRYVFPDGNMGTTGNFSYSYQTSDLDKLKNPVDILNPNERTINDAIKF